MFVPCYLNLLFQITSQVQIRKIFTYTGCITIKRVNYVLFYKMEFFICPLKISTESKDNAIDTLAPVTVEHTLTPFQHVNGQKAA